LAENCNLSKGCKYGETFFSGADGAREAREIDNRLDELNIPFRASRQFRVLLQKVDL
jgi:hypothetical protein